MKKIGMALAIAAGITAQSAYADAYRLAYSKAENIEIFIDHSATANWCGADLNLRAVYGGAIDPNALEKLLPKVGVLLGKQCPQALKLSWTSTDSAGKPLAHGVSSKASGWSLQTDAPIAAAPMPQAASAASASASAQASASAPVSVPASAPASAQASVPASAPAPASASAPAPASAPTPPAVPANSVPMPPIVAVAPSASAPASPSGGSQTVPLQAPAQALLPAQAPASAQSAVPASLRIGGWTSATRDQVLASTKLLRTMQDQNGCKVISTFNMEASALAYVTLKSDGVTCDAQGYATGKGKLRLERSDGARLAQTDNLWFVAGVPFTSEMSGAQLAYVANNGDTLWFDLGSDGVHQQYLIRAEKWRFGSGLDAWRPSRIAVLTNQPDAFRNATEIKVAVDDALHAAESRATPHATQMHIVFADDFAQGLVADNTEHQLYAIDAYRNSNWRGEITGEWRYNLQNGQNYLFQRDEIAARRKQDELRQQAYRERDNLRQYENLVEQTRQNPQAVLARMQHDLPYEPVTGSSYARLMSGHPASVSLVVHVDGHKDADAVVNWPYEMRLIGQRDLKDAWYLVQGQLSVDDEHLDDKGLPMSRLALDKIAPHACQKDGCADLNDPLVVTRMSLGLPDWTPEHAQQIISQAEQNR